MYSSRAAPAPGAGWGRSRAVNGFLPRPAAFCCSAFFIVWKRKQLALILPTATALPKACTEAAGRRGSDTFLPRQRRAGAIHDLPGQQRGVRAVSVCPSLGPAPAFSPEQGTGASEVISKQGSFFPASRKQEWRDPWCCLHLCRGDTRPRLWLWGWPGGGRDPAPLRVTPRGRSKVPLPAGACPDGFTQVSPLVAWSGFSLRNLEPSTALVSLVFSSAAA